MNNKINPDLCIPVEINFTSNLHLQDKIKLYVDPDENFFLNWVYPIEDAWLFMEDEISLKICGTVMQLPGQTFKLPTIGHSYKKFLKLDIWNKKVVKIGDDNRKDYFFNLNDSRNIDYILNSGRINNYPVVATVKRPLLVTPDHYCGREELYCHIILCRRCSEKNTSQFKFCSSCGSELKL